MSFIAWDKLGLPSTYSASESAKRAASMFLSGTGVAALNPTNISADATKIVERRISNNSGMDKRLWELEVAS